MDLSIEDIVIALAASMSWALASMINKVLSRTVDSMHISTVRLWSGFAIMFLFACLFGAYENTSSNSGMDIILLAASGIIALAIGDTVFIKSLSFIYVSQAFPVCQCTFMVMTVVVSILFLSEAFTLVNMVGGGLILGGLYLVAGVGVGYQSNIPALRSASLKGLLLAFSAALAWTIGAVIMKLGLTAINALLAATIRTFSAAAALTVFRYVSHTTNNPSFFKHTELTKISLTVLSGMLGYGGTGIAYVAVMQRAGAGRTVLITSLAPVFVFILSALFLKEKPTLPSLMGTLTCVIGIMFLSA